MEDAILDILDRLRQQMASAPHTPATLGESQLNALLRKHNRGVSDNARHVTKGRLLDYYRAVKRDGPTRWASWNVTPTLDEALLRTLRLKPRRTASGVATITVLTKPWPCSSACIFCPNDLRMPKSYLPSEPACQRAEHNYFDPYLQVAIRLEALHNMGHVTDKVELIVLGGTWSDYPRMYQVWFVTEVFRALNESGASADERRRRYEELGVPCSPKACAHRVATLQAQVNEGSLSYNEAFERLYGTDPAWQRLSRAQTATYEELEREQRANEKAAHRSVGLVVETRPSCVTTEKLAHIRRLGATKVQIGIQSLDGQTLGTSRRLSTPRDTRRALALLRLFGFKLHTHLMLNLPGRTPEQDRHEFDQLVDDPGLRPDEVKVYPCALVEGTPLVRRFEEGAWRPYTLDELMDVLVHDMLAAPEYLRISRMIRDIPSQDILAGNKKLNLRQLVDTRLREGGELPREIRSREIGTRGLASAGDGATREERRGGLAEAGGDTARAGQQRDGLSLEDVTYETSVTEEHFLQWVTPERRIAGFLRLSLPRQGIFGYDGRGRPCEDDGDTAMDDDIHGLALAAHATGDLPVSAGDAMIREVHVYGSVASLGLAVSEEASLAQHQGLGRTLVATAEKIAHTHGYTRLGVISAIGTRDYYRHLGFTDGTGTTVAHLYQWKDLTENG